MIYRTRTIDRKNLLLPDGNRADRLRLTPLRAELERLKIPGLEPDMGKDGLLDCYERHLCSLAEAEAPDSSKASHPRDLTQVLARHARRVIDKIAGSGESDAAPAPSKPILSARV